MFAVSLILGMLCSTFTQYVSASEPLKERAPVPYVPQMSHAVVVNADWIQIELIDKKYNNSNVTNTNYYSITSSDDTQYTTGIQPTLVHYRYFPESAPFNPSLNGNTGTIQNTYNIFLKVPSGAKLKEGKSYTVTINSAVVEAGPFNFVFDLSEPNLVIHSNQVGYLAEGAKVAYLSLWTGQGKVDFSSYPKFYLVNSLNGQTVFEGNVTLSATNDRWSQSDIYAMDFTSFAAEGIYYLYVPSVGRSYSFQISSSIYKDHIAYTVIRGMTMQRDGDHGLDDPNVTHWIRPAAHLDDAIDQALYATNGGNKEAARVDLTGGHMDAGDRGKYPYNSAWTSANLLTAATYYPDQIEALGESLDLPESGNGIPDFLDELVWEMDWLYKAVMNTSTDGTLPNYLRPGSPDAASGGYEQGQPPEGVQDRVIYNKTAGPNKAETLLAAGALAMAYNTPIMQEYFPDKVDDYLIAAERAFDGFIAHKDDPSYLKEQTDYDQTKDGFPNTWSNEMLLAASSLLQATGDEAKYKPWIIDEDEEDDVNLSQLPTTKDSFTSFMHWSWVTKSPMIPVFVSMTLNDYLPAALKTWAANGIVAFADKEMDHQHPFGANMQDEGFPNAIGWRFASSNLFPIVIGYGATQNPDYLKRIQTTWNYELGTNPVSRTFITGLGDPQRQPRWFVHEIYQYQYIQNANGNGGWVEPPPGYPGSDLQSESYPWWYDNAHNAAAKNEVFPAYNNYAPAYRYADSWSTQNEFVIVDLANNAASMLPLIPTQLYDLTVQADNGTVLPAGGSYTAGTEVPLIAQGSPGYKFDHWEGDVTGTANPTTVTMNANKSVTAVFTATPTHALTTNADNGTIQLAPSGGEYNEGETVTLQAVPDHGYAFTGWSGDLSGAANPATLTMDAAKTVTANFEPLNAYTLTVHADGGTVAINPLKDEYLDGEEVVLTATPDLGYRFTSWSGDADGTDSSITVMISKDTEITANFTNVPVYSLAATAGDGGTVTQTGDGSYTSGATVILTATPDAGYLFTGWSGDLVGNVNPATVTMDSNKSVTANFAFRGGIVSLDIGSGIPGTTAFSNEELTIQGSGIGLGNAPDSYRYTFESDVNGNFSISAKLEDLSGGTDDAMAGLLLRKKLDDSSSGDNSQFINVYLKKDGTLNVRARGGGVYFDTIPIRADVSNTATGPVWVKLTRTDSWHFDVYRSDNGTDWVQLVDQVGLWAFNDAPAVYAGLFVGSGSVGSTTTAKISDVEWPVAPKLPPPANVPYSSANIGASATEGLTTIDYMDAGRITISAKTGEMWSDQDSARYVNIGNLKGDSELVAKLESLSGGGGDAIAGIMVRGTLNANSKYAGAAVTKSNTIAHQYRESQWTSKGTSQNIPSSVWLKVTRTTSGSNAVVTTYWSADGADWTTLGSTTFYNGFPEPYTMGLFVAGANTSSLASAVFSQVSWPGGPVQKDPLTATITGVSEVAAGQSIDLDIGLENVSSNIYAFDLTVHFDAVKVELTDIQPIASGLSILDSHETAEGPGHIRILGNTAPDSPMVSDGGLIRLTFLAAELTEATSLDISLSSIETSDEEGDRTDGTAGPAKTIQITVAQTEKAALDASIESVTTVLNDAIEGALWGQYADGSKAALQVVLTNAQTVSGQANATQGQVDAAKTQLDEALATFNGLRNSTASVGDLGVMAAAYGRTSASGNWAIVQRYDQNHDGKIDIEDLAAIARIILNY